MLLFFKSWLNVNFNSLYETSTCVNIGATAYSDHLIIPDLSVNKKLPLSVASWFGYVISPNVNEPLELIFVISVLPNCILLEPGGLASTPKVIQLDRFPIPLSILLVVLPPTKTFLLNVLLPGLCPA